VGQLPYELRFCHKFNLHKLLSMLIDDNDIESIARIYGVETAELKRVEDSFTATIAETANDLGKRFPQSDVPLRLVAIGDSITSDRESYAKILNMMWKDSPNRKVIDCGISGDTTSNIINRFYSTVLIEEFDWAVIFLGTNDARELEGDDISNISLTEFKRNMTYLSDTLLKAGKKLIHVTIPPVDSTRLQAFFVGANWVYNLERIKATNDFIRELSESRGTFLADLAIAIDSYDGEILESDGIHINKNGHKLLTEMLLKIVS